MIVYWAMYCVPAFFALFNLTLWNPRSRKLAGAIIVFLFLFIGFRETCGDYPRYELLFKLISYEDWTFATTQTEFIYGAINWFVARMGLPFLAVTCITSVIYSYCLWRFVTREPSPIIALAIATSYLTIVVAMGYTRQGVAIALIMLATVYIRDNRPLASTITIFIATGFHSSAAIAFLLVFFSIRFKSETYSRLVGSLLIALAIYGAYSIYSDKLDSYLQNYIESGRYSSDGAVQRLFLCWVAGGIVLFYRRYFPKGERGMWVATSFASLGTFMLLFVTSTVADRLGLYVLPLQIVAFGRLPFFQNSPLMVKAVAVAVLFAYMMVLGVWLLLGNFASELWLPYKSAIFGVIE